jgi:hypothetical protein
VVHEKGFGHCPTNFNPLIQNGLISTVDRVIEFLVCQKILSNSFSFRVLIDNQDWNLFWLDNQNSFVLGAGYFLGIAQTNSVANLAIENV